MKRRGLAVVGLLASALAPATARATGFTDIGQDHLPVDTTTLKLDGYLRVRGDLFYNMDLDRGLTPSGKPLFPVPLNDPTGQTLSYADMRFRNDLAIYAPGGMVAVKARFDVLDNQQLGGNADGIPSASVTQDSPSAPIKVKRVYGEVVTPVGVIAAGRMGSHWGLGILANGGDCADCDGGDAADRIAFLTPIAGHVFVAAYDFTAIGPSVPGAAPGRYIAIDPSANTNTLTFAVLRFKDDFGRERRRAAGKTTVEYGAYLSHRWQNDDVPATYLPTAQPIPITSSQVLARGYLATAIDGWARITHPYFRIEAEAVYLAASVEQPSLIPGVVYHQPVTSNQWGAALESEFGPAGHPLGAGLDAGVASGDPAPGFGANVPIGAPVAQPGDLTGAKADPPRKNTVDNFQFSPDYRVDQILFREIIGTVTGAAYVRPHARWHLVRAPSMTLSAQVAGIASWALYPASAPGGKAPLGLEIDPSLIYATKAGFGVELDYAVLVPFAGLDNPAQNLTAKPAQLARARLFFRF